MSVPLFPLFAHLHGRLTLVVGGGEVAARKIDALRLAGARVRVVAPRLLPRLAALAAERAIEYRPGPFQPQWLEQVWLVVAATDDPAVNQAVAAAAETRRIWVNVVDDVELSSVHLPAVVERGRVQVAISTGGAAPMLATELRARLEMQLEPTLGALADLLARQRPAIRRRFPQLPTRRAFYRQVLDGEVADHLRRRQPLAAERALLQALGQRPARGGNGLVTLVGAGPGDPGLLTLNGQRALQRADVILYDRLVSAQVLALARRDAERIAVGKRVGDARTAQDAIHALLLEHASAGRHVVRLKGGDPFVFGRGGEELTFLRNHGIAYEVVPGITAALACAAYAGVPLTHREHAQSLRLLTAHSQGAFDDLDWPTLAAGRQTLAIYMGASNLATLTQRLLAHGRDPATPFALIENGSQPQQRVLTGVLSDLPALAQRHALAAPALLIVGEVAAYARSLHWFGAPPLAGERSDNAHLAQVA